VHDYCCHHHPRASSQGGAHIWDLGLMLGSWAGRTAFTSWALEPLLTLGAL
jgi:hypothetical protein